MPRLVNPRLIHAPTGDPGLFLPFFHQKRALLFDLGDLGGLSPKDLLKISHVFVSHTHMDHFIGFDQLLRILLGREKELQLFGPQPIIENIRGKLAGYTWNLVENYSAPLALTVTEIGDDRSTTCRFECRNRFVPAGSKTAPAGLPTLLSEPGFSVETAVLDHDIACLAFAVKERFHINIRKDVLAEMGLPAGPWLYDFKQALFEKKPPDTPIEVPAAKTATPERFALGELTEKLAIITEGQKIAYITDAACTDANISKMVRLAAEADHLFIEAAFLEKDRSIAAAKRHLTAYQAGQIAALAGAKRFTLFHFSPRYSGQSGPFDAEARSAYEETIQMGQTR
ncbi:MAG: ribonuclease Z [Thermodesulfobacteriota bacterium]